MPELPEVETVRRILEQRYVGQTITSVTLGKPTFYRAPPRSAIKILTGGTVSGFKRRGKYLIIVIAGRGEVIFHLGMSGRITIEGESPHVRFQMRIGNETVRFHDARRFGRVGCLLPNLGPEPMDPGFTPGYLWSVLHRRAAPVKALLMNQKLVAGLGNIYATEALHAAKIRPGRAGKSLRRSEVEKLALSCRAILKHGIESGGATLNDEAFLDPLGRPGRMQMSVLVYGRKDCGTCGGPVIDTRKNIGGRASVYCPACQS